MNTLHLLYTSEALTDCQKTLLPHDAIIFLQESVYLLTENMQLPKLTNCYALKADIDARGISLSNSTSIIDDSAFVDLVIQYNNSISWL